MDDFMQTITFYFILQIQNEESFNLMSLMDLKDKNINIVFG